MDVLIIDDDQDIRSRYARILERAGFAVQAADSGLAALAMLQTVTPRAIVSDIRMAFLEGQSFYRELKEEHPELARRTIFVTGAGHDPDVEAFGRTTGRPILTKPVEADVLVTAVSRLVKGKA